MLLISKLYVEKFYTHARMHTPTHTCREGGYCNSSGGILEWSSGFKRAEAVISLLQVPRPRSFVSATQ